LAEAKYFKKYIDTLTYALLVQRVSSHRCPELSCKKQSPDSLWGWRRTSKFSELTVQQERDLLSMLYTENYFVLLSFAVFPFFGE